MQIHRSQKGPFHHTYIRLPEGEERRSKACCKFYDRNKGYCRCKDSGYCDKQCSGCTYCEQYVKKFGC